MPSASFKAFVSSTFEDLAAHRAHVIRQLRKAGIFVDPMEDWTAECDQPQRFSQDRLAGCDFCVLLVALRRGHVPDGETRSITQLEYQAALDLGIDVLVFMLDEGSAWPYRFVELDKDPQIGEWRRELAKRHGVELFGLEPKSLEVASAVTRWVEKQSRKATQVGADWIQLVSNLLELPREQPNTWKIAADLLPHALDAVRRAYTGNEAAASPAQAATPAQATEVAQPMKAIVEGARVYFEESRARFERTCFVIMPFGSRNVGDGHVLDFDAAYRELFVPAIQAAGLEPLRVDQEYLVGTAPMETYQYLEHSRVVLADVSALAANVFYELGIRHRARQSGTVVVRDARGIRSPFDLAFVRIFDYDLSTDRAVERSTDALRAALERAMQGQIDDSPAHLQGDGHPSGAG
jgi:Domain of unknown function (DUF4062)